MISDDDDFGSLYNKLSIIGSDILLKTIKLVVSGKSVVHKQVENKNLNVAPKLDSINTKINWNDSTDKILGMIRGLSPIPGSWTILKNGDNEIRLKILKASLIRNLIIDDEIHIKAKDGTINCTKIQLENKKEMSVKDLLNGFKFHENSRVY